MEHSKLEAKTLTSHNNSLFESRFKVLLFIFRLGGIPLNMKSISRLNAVYNATVIVCFYITNFCVCADTFVHRHQLKLAMQKFRVLLALQMAVWSHFSAR
jgi:hypothetical protein